MTEVPFHMQRKRSNSFPWKTVLILILTDLWILQNPIQQNFRPFTYFDEATAAVGAVFFLVFLLKNGFSRFSKDTKWILGFLAAFVLSGLLGNVIWLYQPPLTVLTDVLANTKFFFTLFLGYLAYRRFAKDIPVRAIRFDLYILSSVLFFLFIIDLLFHIFPSDGTRYHLRAVMLIFSHPTFLAATCAFLIAAIILVSGKRGLPFILMDLILLASTLRIRAFLAILLYAAAFLFLHVYKGRPAWYHLIPAAGTCVAVSWQRFRYFFVEKANTSARSVMTRTSFRILRDCFPIGTGFGTFASHAACTHYSPVYRLYGFEEIPGLTSKDPLNFFDETFWPIIFGQTGVLGSVCYLAAQFLLIRKIFRQWEEQRQATIACLYAYGYLLISSTSESAFNNPLACPFALLIGIVLAI